MKERSECTIAWSGSLYHIRVNLKDDGILLSGWRYDYKAREKGGIVPRERTTCDAPYVTEGPGPGRSEADQLAQGQGTEEDHDADFNIPCVPLPIKCKRCQKVTIVGLDITSDSSLGLRYPCIILKSAHFKSKRSSTRACTFYIIHLRGGVFVCVGKMCSDDTGGVSTKAMEECEDLTVGDGPGLCYSYNGTVYVGRCLGHQQQRMETGKVEFPEVPGQHVSITVLAMKMLNINEILLILNVPSSLSASGQHIVKTTDHQERKIVVVSLTFQISVNSTASTALSGISSTNNVRLSFLEETDFIPQIYSSTVRKVLIHYVRRGPTLHGVGFVARSTDQASQYDNFLFIFTSNKQLLQFSNGCLISCIGVDVCGEVLKMVTFKSPVGESYVVLLDEQQNVYSIGISTCQMHKTFSGVYDLFIDDVLGRGNDQLLMMNGKGSTRTSFTLTDLHTTHFTLGQPQEEATECRGDKEDKLQVAIIALKGRLQAGLTHLSWLQRELNNKKTHVENVSDSIQHVLLGRGGTRTCQVELQALLTETECFDPLAGGDFAKFPAESQSSEASKESVVDVTELWQRIVEGDQWVVAANITNNGQRCFRNVTGFLLMDTADEKWSSYCRFHTTNPDKTIPQKRFATSADSDVYISQRKTKKAKYLPVVTSGPNASFMSVHPLEADLPPGDSGIVLVVTTVPDFKCFTRVNATVILVWSEDYQPPHHNAGHLLPLVGHLRNEEGAVRQLPVGTVSLVVNDLITERFLVKTAIEDCDSSATYVMCNRLALDAVQLSTELSVHSAHTDLSPLEACLTGHLHFQWSAGYKCYLSHTPSLSGVRVELHFMERPRQRHFTVYTRDEAQLFLYVHALYRVLSDDVIILPHEDNLSLTVVSTLQAIHDEVSTRASRLKTQLKGSAPTQSQHEPLSDIPDTARQTFIGRKRQTCEGDNTIGESNEGFEKFATVVKQLEHVTEERVKYLCTALEKKTIGDNFFM